MYAVIESGGRQYKVKPGDTASIEKIDHKVGEKVNFDVLVYSNQKTVIGTPYVKEAKVVGVVTAHKKAPKILVFKKKRRQGYRRTQGHRQMYTKLFIESISSDKGSEIAEKHPVLSYKTTKRG